MTPPETKGESKTSARAIRVAGAAGRAVLRRREAAMMPVALVLVLYFQLSTGAFWTQDNAVNTSQYVAAPAIIGAAQVLLLVSREIDLSVGQVYTMAPFLMYYGIEYYSLSPFVAIGGALLVCAAIGLINGLVTVALKVPSFVTTLGMLSLIQGVTLTTSGAQPFGIPDSAVGIQPWMGRAMWAELVWTLVIIAVLHVLLSYTRWGLHTVAVGGNLIGASEAGIRAGRIKVGNFMLCSLLGGLTGIIEAFRINTIDPNSGGTDIMFAAVAAAVIGGTALSGGSGTIIGALLGAIVLGVLQTGFNLIGVSADTIYMVTGGAILLAMVANVYLTRLRSAGRS